MAGGGFDPCVLCCLEMAYSSYLCGRFGADVSCHTLDN